MTPTRKAKAEMLARIHAGAEAEHAGHLAERLALYQALDAGVSWATLARHGYPDWASPHHNRRNIERGYKSWREAGSPTDVSEWLAMMWV